MVPLVHQGSSSDLDALPAAFVDACPGVGPWQWHQRPSIGTWFDRKVRWCVGRANLGAPAMEQGSGPWRRLGEGSSCCTGGDGSPAHFGQAMRRCQLRCRNPGAGRSWLPATSAKPAKKCREEAGGQTPAENVTERPPAPGSGLGKAYSRHPSSFSDTIGWPLVHAGTN